MKLGTVFIIISWLHFRALSQSTECEYPLNNEGNGPFPWALSTTTSLSIFSFCRVPHGEESYLISGRASDAAISSVLASETNAGFIFLLDGWGHTIWKYFITQSTSPVYSCAINT